MKGSSLFVGILTGCTGATQVISAPIVGIVAENFCRVAILKYAGIFGGNIVLNPLAGLSE
jgi:hypothetical protein